MILIVAGRTAVVLILISCGKEEHNEGVTLEPVIEKEFLSYVQLFEKIGKINKSSIRFSSSEDIVLMENVIGRDLKGWCDINRRSIFIDKDGWIQFSADEKEVLILHELGHCEVGLKHNRALVRITQESGNSWHREKSIMYPYVISGATYQKYHTEYLEQLRLEIENPNEANSKAYDFDYIED